MAIGVHFMLLTLSILFGTSVQGSAPCPKYWSQFQDKCYTHPQDWGVTWEEANKRCARQGGILAEPDTVEKWQYLLNNLEAWGWIGGRRTDGTLAWSSSGRPINVPSAWYPGEPGPDSVFGPEEDENCVFMYTTGWRDRTCEATAYYICEKPANVV